MAKAPKSSGAGDTALVKVLADIFDEAGLAELEYETADLSVRLSRVSSAAHVAPVAAVAAPEPAPAIAPAGPGIALVAALIAPDLKAFRVLPACGSGFIGFDALEA